MPFKMMSQLLMEALLVLMKEHNSYMGIGSLLPGERNQPIAISQTIPKAPTTTKPTDSLLCLTRPTNLNPTPTPQELILT